MAAADAPATARRFVATELAIADVAAVGALKVTKSACFVHVRAGRLQGDVSFIATSTQRYTVGGFNLGDSSGLSLELRGRHLDAAYDSDCRECASWEMHVRYGDALTSVGPARNSRMTADLSRNPSVFGGYVFVDRLANGSIRNANALTVPPGNFAAS